MVRLEDLKKKKIVIINNSANEELFNFDCRIIKGFRRLFLKLEYNGYLRYPHGKKIKSHNGLFECRIRINKNIYRAIYAYITNNRVVMLCFFHKKQQKIPNKILKISKQRLTLYIINDENKRV